MRERYAAMLDRQHQCPSGVVGQLVGEKMLRQHQPETDWSIAQLALAPGDHVLEIGFGAGRGLARIVRQLRPGRAVGLDLSLAMLRAARWRNASAVRAGCLALLRGDVAALPFADQQFSKVLSIHTFYFWPEPTQVLRDLFRVLRPGGLLVATLSTGRIAPSGERRYGPLQSELERSILPSLKPLGFRAAELRHGPDSRQYTSVAIVAQR